MLQTTPNYGPERDEEVLRSPQLQFLKLDLLLLALPCALPRTVPIVCPTRGLASWGLAHRSRSGAVIRWLFCMQMQV